MPPHIKAEKKERFVALEEIKERMSAAIEKGKKDGKESAQDKMSKVLEAKRKKFNEEMKGVEGYTEEDIQLDPKERRKRRRMKVKTKYILAELRRKVEEGSPPSEI